MKGEKLKSAGRKGTYLALLVMIGGISCLFLFRAGLRDLWRRAEGRPLTKFDLKSLKRHAFELWERNTLKLSLAGSPPKPMSTDTFRLAHPGDIGQINDIFSRELINALGYATAIRSTVSEHTVRVPVNELVPLTVTGQNAVSHAGISRLAISNSGTGMVAISDMQVVTSLAADRPAIFSKARSETNLVSRSRILFEFLVRSRVNGVSPNSGRFNMSFHELYDVFGYGQCHNQSAALAGLFAGFGIHTRLLHFDDTSHTVVEAELEPDKWVVFDPLLAIAFMSSDPPWLGDLKAIQGNLQDSLDRAGLRGLDLKEATQYYSSTRQTREEMHPQPMTGGLHCDVWPGEMVELLFDGGYPRLVSGTLGVPPPNVIGFLRHTLSLIRLQTNSHGFRILLEMPTPITDVEIGWKQSPPPGLTLHFIAQTDEQVSPPDDSRLWRLRRYVTAGTNNLEQCELEFTGVTRDQLTASLDSIRVISQCSLKRFDLGGPPMLKIVSDDPSAELLCKVESAR